MQLIRLVASLAIYLFFFNRSTLGNRNKSRKWPRWMEHLGDRDIPKIIGSDWFFWFAWISRRVLPILMAVTVLSLWDYMFENRVQYLLSGPDWLAILALSFGCFVAYTPFAEKPRRHPIDKWMGMLFGIQFVAFGLLLGGAALTLHHVHIESASNSGLWHFIRWLTFSSLSTTLGISAGMIGFGVTIMGLVEILPNWRTGVNVIDNSAELEELRIRNEKLESENKKLRQKLRSWSRPHHR